MPAKRPPQIPAVSASKEEACTKAGSDDERSGFESLTVKETTVLPIWKAAV